MKNSSVNNREKQNEKKSGINPITAAVTGAIVGAGVAIAGTIALKNKKNRKEVKQVFTNLKDQAMGYVEKMQKEIKGKKVSIEKKLLTEVDNEKKKSTMGSTKIVSLKKA